MANKKAVQVDFSGMMDNAKRLAYFIIESNKKDFPYPVSIKKLPDGKHWTFDGEAFLDTTVLFAVAIIMRQKKRVPKPLYEIRDRIKSAGVKK